MICATLVNTQTHTQTDSFFILLSMEMRLSN